MRRVAGAVLTAALVVGLGAFMLRRVNAPGTNPGTRVTSGGAPQRRAHPVAAGVAGEPGQAPLVRVEPTEHRSPFATEDDYLRELAQLNRTDKRRALSLVEKGEAWYQASGVRAEARRAMGITLLVDLGDMDEARVRTRRFIAEHPDSAYRPLVQGVTGIHPRPSGPRGAPP